MVLTARLIRGHDMIDTIDLAISARRPCVPLPPLVALESSPSVLRFVVASCTVDICGITRLYLSVTMPDNSVVGIDATQVDTAYHAIVPACSTPGEVLGGWTVYIDGVDAAGVAFTGLALGRGDVVVLDADRSVEPGQVVHVMRLVSSPTRPENPREGDVWAGPGGWMVYDGLSWVPPAAFIYASSTNRYHKLVAEQNENGNITTAVDQQGAEL